uniref:Uncharacterized protein n=1 Tax=Anguilla anguilla TaxID=7936 RepID=A0A0E9PV19_ANGAN
MVGFVRSSVKNRIFLFLLFW